MTEIAVGRENAVVTLTMSNPERKNALDGDATETMADRLREAAHDWSVRCVVVRGEGEAFCSGIDLADDLGGGGAAAELEGGLNAIATSLLRMEKPVVAAVSGPAIGAGAAIATACDFVYATDSATFGWGFTDIGLAPDTGATYVLPRLVGHRRAMELLTTAERIGADEAVELGIANESCLEGALDEFVAERTAELAARPTRAVGAAKRLLARNGHRSLEEALAAEARTQDRMVETEDFSEGIQAFIEDRDPTFAGR